jgi:hypothetical protein
MEHVPFSTSWKDNKELIFAISQPVMKAGLIQMSSKFDLDWSRRSGPHSTEDDDNFNKSNACGVLENSGLTLVDWLPQNASFNGQYFNENILQRIAAELNGGGKKKHRPWTLLHMDNAKPHRSKRNLARME